MSLSTQDLEPTFWYCEDHHTVEKFDGCGGPHRIGPFATEAEAAHALQTIAERERAFDAEDEKWDNG